MSAVQVAVRVRPFNGRETAMGSLLGIDMSDSTTIAYSEGQAAFDEDEVGVKKEYNFDFSIWSHYTSQGQDAGENAARPDRLNYDQKMLYDNIGSVLFNNFWGPDNNGGFDVCMFAYGQSGSGKSFSMTGAGPVCAPKLQGIIPRITTDVFNRMNEIEAKDKSSKFKVTCSMLEIYINKIYDLLIPVDEYNVKTRKHLEMQLSNVKGLSQVPVKSYEDVSALLIRGFQNQYKAPTGLNVDSSRGHTVFTMTVVQVITGVKKGKPYKQEIHKTMQLIDLAGSERSEKMLSITKEKLQTLLEQKHRDQGGRKPPKVTDKYFAKYLAERKSEGTAINTSLTVLGKCVEEVAKAAGISNKKKRATRMKQISWRSSELTRLLRPALSGQSKTIMIAACSPSCTEFEETVSTMRYCDNIKKIPSTAKAKVRTKSAEEKLKEQLEVMQKQLAEALAGGGGGGGGNSGGDPEEMKALREAMAQMQEDQAEAKAREVKMEAQMAKLRAEEEERKKNKQVAHLLKMTSNPMTSGLFPTPIQEGKAVVCGQSDEASVTMALKGTGVQNVHVIFVYEGGSVFCDPTPGASVFINGKSCMSKIKLRHSDRLRLAADNYFRYIDPVAQGKMSPDDIEEEDTKYDYNFIKEEAMAELIKGFEKDDQDAADVAARAKKLAAELKKREKEFATERQALEAELKSLRSHHTAEMHDLEDKMKAAAAAGNKQREAQYRAQLNQLKAEADATLLEQETALKQRLQEEKEYRDMMIMESRKAEQARKNQKAQIHYDLLDVLPCISQCNDFARELGINVSFDAKIVASRSTGGSSAQVMVELIDNGSDAVERWSVSTFRTKFGEIMQEYQDNRVNLANNKAIELHPLSPFKINKDSLQTIGYATVVLKALFFNMDISAKVGIVSNVTGQISGQLSVAIEPLWADDEQEEEAMNSDSLHQLKGLEFLDLRVQFKKAEALPPALASDVRCKFSLPSYISSAVLPEHYMDDKSSVSFAEINNGIKKGAVYMSPSNQETLDQLIINPEIGYDRVIRIFDLNYKVREWFKNADLMVEVLGEPPPAQISSPVVEHKKQAPRKSIHKNDKRTLNRLEQTHGKLQTTRVALQDTIISRDDAHGDIEELKKKLARTESVARHAKDESKTAAVKLKAMQDQLAAVQHELDAARGEPSNASQSYEDLQKELEDLRTQKNSSACCML